MIKWYVYEFVHELVNPKYLIYFGLLIRYKYNIGKITLVRDVKKLVIGSNQTCKFRQINLVQVNLEAHDSDKSTSTRQQYKWISSLFVCFKWYLDSNFLRRIHKWCLDQLTSDILQVVLIVAEPPNLMPPKSTHLPLDTKYSRENTKLRGSVRHI